jgi:hypothetical protein
MGLSPSKSNKIIKNENLYNNNNNNNNNLKQINNKTYQYDTNVNEKNDQNMVNTQPDSSKQMSDNFVAETYIGNYNTLNKPQLEENKEMEDTYSNINNQQSTSNNDIDNLLQQETENNQTPAINKLENEVQGNIFKNDEITVLKSNTIQTIPDTFSSHENQPVNSIPKQSLDEISLKYEENVNLILQRHVISERKFDEMKISNNIVTNFRVNMNTFSNQLQMELDLYVRNIEKYFKNAGYIIPPMDESIIKKTQKNNETQRSALSARKIFETPKSIVDTDNLTHTRASYLFENSPNFNNKINQKDDKMTSPFLNDSQLASTTLDKTLTFDTSKTYESVDESIVNWIETIEQLHQNNELMKYCSSRSRSSFKTYKELKEFLKTPLTKNELEKAWLVYLWITNNISYDVNTFKEVKRFDGNPSSVFLKSSTISAGYSILFKDLCESLSLKSSHIKGYAKGFSFEKSRKPLFHENHDWNTVQINNRLYLVECTWGAGYVTPEHKFKKKFQPYYFCAPPHVFIQQHFSENFQYQTVKLSFEEFHQLAFKKLEFYLLGLYSLNTNSTNLKLDENPTQLLFSATSNIHLAANLKNENKEKIKDCIFIQKNNENNFEINIVLPDLKQYSLDVFALNESKNQYSFICRYYLKTERLVEKEKLKWCKSYQTKKNVYLFQPINMQIDLNKKYTFKLYADVDDVALIDSKNNFFNFEKIAFEKNIWYLEKSSFIKGNLDICVKYDKKDTFWTCFTYEVF